MTKKRDSKTKDSKKLRAAVKQRDKIIAVLKERLDKWERQDLVRKEGEHWYELVEHFDAKDIKRIPVESGKAYVMGRLDHLVVVEVARGTSQQGLADLGAWLERHKIQALIVTEGVKFVKLRSVSEEDEAKLDAYELAQLVQRKAAEMEERANGNDDASAGPELHSNGVGDSGPGDGENHRSRSDPNREGISEGAP